MRAKLSIKQQKLLHNPKNKQSLGTLVGYSSVVMPSVVGIANSRRPKQVMCIRQLHALIKNSIFQFQGSQAFGKKSEICYILLMWSHGKRKNLTIL